MPWRTLPLFGLALALAACGPAPEPSQKPPAPAETRAGVGDPLGFVRAVYTRYAGGRSGGLGTASPAYSPRLAQAYAQARSLPFDPWLGATDGEITALSVEEAPPPAPERRVIVARFRNDGRPVANRFEFVGEGRRWFLDDIVNEPGGAAAADASGAPNGWRLSGLLAEAG